MDTQLLEPPVYATTLVVDLDGTLTPTDTLAEAVVHLVKHHPLNLFKLPLWLLQGRASFKDRIATSSDFSVEDLPFREQLLEYLRAEKARGRRLLLATAAHGSIAHAVALKLNLFDEVIASDATHNLKGATKLKAIRESTGADFVYAGDSRADLPIWKDAKAAVLVNTSRSVASQVTKQVAVEKVFPKPQQTLKTWMRALRVHQWMKNLLLFVPLLTAFSFVDIRPLALSMLAFLAFSLIASGTYIVNDLLDVENDRTHVRKRLRPFASGRLSIVKGVIAAAMLLIVGASLAATLSLNFLAMLALYVVMTSLYSWVLKRHVIIDALVLSLLYTLRILAGAVAIEVHVTAWLLMFSVFMFFSLALVKRCSELVSVGKEGVRFTNGRDYFFADLAVLWPLGVGSGLCSVVVFCLFTTAADTQLKYHTPQLLWIAAVGLIYWITRLWIKTGRKEMHDDPMVYAVRDYGSRMTITFIIVVIIAARFLHLPSL